MLLSFIFAALGAGYLMGCPWFFREVTKVGQDYPQKQKLPPAFVAALSVFWPVVFVFAGAALLLGKGK